MTVQFTICAVAGLELVDFTFKTSINFKNF